MKMSEIKVEESWRRGRPKKKWIGFIKEITKAYEVEGNIVKDMEG